MNMEYFIEKKIPKQIKTLYQAGGPFQKAAEKVKQIIGDIHLGTQEPLNGIKRTNHGENRVRHCIKYDLTGFVRLITIQHEGICILIFVGNHDDCDKWLEEKKGLNLAFDPVDKTMVEVIVSGDLSDPEKRQYSDSDYTEGKLYKKLKYHYFRVIADQLNYSVLQPFLEFESDTTDDELLTACMKIANQNLQSIFLDVFESLKKGDTDGAKNRILLYEEELKLLEEASKEEKDELISNDQFIKLNELEAEYLKGILETKDWYDWMLFLHPMQRKVVDSDFSGSARLLGVSGSGKTCVLVHRAVRLAQKYKGEKILILTLNPSLARLINELISILLENAQQKELSEFIQVSSFWEICRDLLIEYDGHPLRERILNPKTDRHEDTIDEVWEEYYKCQNNNDDAAILFPIHQTLLVRGILPMEYIKQEFDWVRSAFPANQRQEYLAVEREGRKIPITEEDRKLILDGLEKWDHKMEDVGAIDYLGLANRLINYIDKIQSTYKCILVDESQDFGTIELKIIRKLVSQGENDIFLVGDIAQQVYNKHHKMKMAGITIPSNAYLQILKNYRNSREILEAAYAIFQGNVNKEDYRSDDFEILNPEYANFSSPKPFIRKGLSVEDELFSALDYLKDMIELGSDEKGCVSICGYSIFEVAEIAKKLGLPTLDGENDLSGGTIFLSDLEQAKGFEFDRMIILNCNKHVFPNPRLPKEEWYREISKLYVAMTRAKKELIISWSTELSGIFQGQKKFFRRDNWHKHLMERPDIKFDIKEITAERKSTNKNGSLLGREFLYTPSAIGISRELQNKLAELVNGNRSFDPNRKRDGWQNMGDLREYVNSRRADIPTLNRVFGPVVFQELKQLLGEPSTK